MRKCLLALCALAVFALPSYGWGRHYVLVQPAVAVPQQHVLLVPTTAYHALYATPGYVPAPYAYPTLSYALVPQAACPVTGMAAPAQAPLPQPQAAPRPQANVATDLAISLLSNPENIKQMFLLVEQIVELVRQHQQKVGTPAVLQKQ